MLHTTFPYDLMHSFSCPLSRSPSSHFPTM
jgi:hypothetical protein